MVEGPHEPKRVGTPKLIERVESTRKGERSLSVFLVQINKLMIYSGVLLGPDTEYLLLIIYEVSKRLSRAVNSCFPAASIDINTAGECGKMMVTLSVDSIKNIALDLFA